MIRAFGRNENPDIVFVWEWFEFQIALLGESHAGVLRRLMSLEMSARPHEARLVGLTPEEVSAYFDAQRNQLNLLTMFSACVIRYPLNCVAIHNGGINRIKSRQTSNTSFGV